MLNVVQISTVCQQNNYVSKNQVCRIIFYSIQLYKNEICSSKKKIIIKIIKPYNL